MFISFYFESNSFKRISTFLFATSNFNFNYWLAKSSFFIVSRRLLIISSFFVGGLCNKFDFIYDSSNFSS